jgi:hypothetical protein
MDVTTTINHAWAANAEGCAEARWQSGHGRAWHAEVRDLPLREAHPDWADELAALNALGEMADRWAATTAVEPRPLMTEEEATSLAYVFLGGICD